MLDKLCVFTQVQPAGAMVQGAPKWMSRWASLADSYTESGPSSGLFDMLTQMEPSGGGKPPEEKLVYLK